MQINKCDRCGKEIIVYEFSPIKLPVVSISLIREFGDRVNIDLCSDCKEDFIKWLRTKENNDE